MAKPITKKHNFKHLEKVYKVSGEATTKEVGGEITESNFLGLIPLGALVTKDLKRSAILIMIVVLMITFLGVLVYKTDILSGLLSRYSLKY